MKLKEKDNVPRIRFDYFKEEWNEKRFKDFTKLSQGLQIAISSRFLEDGENRYFYITNEFLNPNSTKKYYIESPSENVICTVDDILMTRTGNTGKVITNISGAFHNNFFKVDYDNFETSKMFLYYLLTSNNIHKEMIIRAGNSTIPDLNHSDFYSIKTSVPSLPEQSAIGSLFRTLDDLLESYKDNLSNYQVLKATMLSKMFPKAGQKVPEIRLDGFEGEWEKSKLKDVAHRVQGNDGRMDLPTLTISASGGWMNQIDRFSSNIARKKQKNYTLLKKGELSYNHGNSKLAKYGVVFELQAYEEALVPKVYHSFRVNQLADSKFIEIMFSTKIPDRELGKLISSGARMDGLLNISFDDFMNIAIIIPTIKEQQAIGSYFSNLDNLINSHQEKVSQLETLKKKLLQEMFI